MDDLKIVIYYNHFSSTLLRIKENDLKGKSEEVIHFLIREKMRNLLGYIPDRYSFSYLDKEYNENSLSSVKEPQAKLSTLEPLIPKWEYMTLNPHKNLMGYNLNHWGEMGWELISIYNKPGDTDPVFYFKRQKS